jgi:hypothetical protein
VSGHGNTQCFETSLESNHAPNDCNKARPQKSLIAARMADFWRDHGEGKAAFQKKTLSETAVQRNAHFAINTADARN